jgi:Uma2 family endonuclease
VLTEHDRVEVINGYLVGKMVQNDPHLTADELCGRALEKAVPPGWHVRSAKPVRLPPGSKPEPDRSVVRGEIRDYSERSPGAEDTGLVVEVAVSSLAQDRALAAMNAAAGIPIYWIVNVISRSVEVYSEPGITGYQVRFEYGAGQHVPLLLNGVQTGSVAVDDVLP